MNKVLFILLVLLFVLQWVIPGKMIYQSERVLDYGNPLKFRIEALDPYDPFRGKYVTINFADEKLELRESNAYDLSGEQLYITFQEDASGYSIPDKASKEEPDHKPYIKATVRAIDSSSVRIDYPLDRYYMNEYKAPEADRLMANIDDEISREAWIILRIEGDIHVIESVFIDGQSIEDLTRNILDSRK